MNLRKWLLPAAVVMLLAAGYRGWGWPGVALVAGGLTMWLLLHWNRTMSALQRAARQPVGHVGSAVMLHARLRTGVTLLHVIALTRSLGTLLTPKNEQPERYRWTDGTQSTVTCEFRDGRLVKWELVRPTDEAPAEPAGTSGTGAP